MSDINKLLEIASQSITSSKKEKKIKYTEVHNFILDYKVQAGDTPISNGIIYEHYRIWKQDKDLKSRKEFFKEFCQFFEKKRAAHERFFFLDHSTFNLSDQMYEIARRNQEIETQNEKNKKTIKNQVSRITAKE